MLTYQEGLFYRYNYGIYYSFEALNEIFEPKDKKSRDQGMYEAHLQYGYTLKDIAEYICIHYTTVNRAIKKNEREDEK